MSQLIIIDYDETYTADKSLWDRFIVDALRKSHRVICCTMRVAELENLNQDVLKDMGKHNVPIIYSANANDKWEAVENAGYQPKNAIWIDDKPMFICINRSLDQLL